jgi:hypothetical protein
MRERVRAAIQTLPEGQRLATILFYINGYSQEEIAGFLEIFVDWTCSHEMSHIWEVTSPHLFGQKATAQQRGSPQSAQRELFDRLENVPPATLI